MEERGILDPLKVTRTALQNASSVAVMALITQALVTDIPEKKKLGREALRSKLKQLGFYQLQKSCFIHPFDCKSEVDYISELFEVSPYMNFIVAKEIEGARLLQKFFGLAQ